MLPGYRKILFFLFPIHSFRLDGIAGPGPTFYTLSNYKGRCSNPQFLAKPYIHSVLRTTLLYHCIDTKIFKMRTFTTFLALAAGAYAQSSAYTDDVTGITFQGYTDSTTGFKYGMAVPTTPATDFIGQMVNTYILC